MTKLYLAIPCYNEEEVLWDTAEKLLNKFYDMMSERKITQTSRIVFIDDGVILEQAAPDEFFSNPKNPRLKDFLSKVL